MQGRKCQTFEVQRKLQEKAPEKNHEVTRIRKINQHAK